MPFYEYQCTACSHRLEVLQKISDAPLTDCPQCGQAHLKKLISRVGFRLKGGGWYETDFKGGKKPAPDNADSASDKKSSSDDSVNKGGANKSGGNKDGASSSDKAAGKSSADSSKKSDKQSNAQSNSTAGNSSART